MTKPNYPYMIINVLRQRSQYIPGGHDLVSIRAHVFERNSDGIDRRYQDFAFEIVIPAVLLIDVALQIATTLDLAACALAAAEHRVIGLEDATTHVITGERGVLGGMLYEFAQRINRREEEPSL
jgi:hypothetical protein